MNYTLRTQEKNGVLSNPDGSFTDRGSVILLELYKQGGKNECYTLKQMKCVKVLLGLPKQHGKWTLIPGADVSQLFILSWYF